MLQTLRQSQESRLSARKHLESLEITLVPKEEIFRAPIIQYPPPFIHPSKLLPPTPELTWTERAEDLWIHFVFNLQEKVKTLRFSFLAIYILAIAVGICVYYLDQSWTGAPASQTIQGNTDSVESPFQLPTINDIIHLVQS